MKRQQPITGQCTFPASILALDWLSHGPWSTRQNTETHDKCHTTKDGVQFEDLPICTSIWPLQVSGYRWQRPGHRKRHATNSYVYETYPIRARSQQITPHWPWMVPTPCWHCSAHTRMPLAWNPIPKIRMVQNTLEFPMLHQCRNTFWHAPCTQSSLQTGSRADGIVPCNPALLLQRFVPSQPLPHLSTSWILIGNLQPRRWQYFTCSMAGTTSTHNWMPIILQTAGTSNHP